jgi:RNA polymerase sigma-70 factor (ECF subfamily)
MESIESADSFPQLLQRARAGSNEAAWELVQRYGPYVLRSIRRTIGQEIRGKFDSGDFAQAVWASFFSAPEQFHQVNEPQQFVSLLATMARNKVIDEMRRRMLTQKYAVGRERPLCQGLEETAELASKDPTPSQFAIARERWLAMLQSQPERDRQVIRLKLMGRSYASIAKRMEVSERTVRRIIDRLMEREAG